MIRSHTWKMWEDCTLIFVGTVDERIIGAALAFPTINQSFCLHKVFVKREELNQGIRKQLMQKLLEALATHPTFLTVNPKNRNALKLYEKLGFVDREFVPNFYKKIDTSSIAPLCNLRYQSP